ncbi:MAG: bifunctional adenosylcobinamide kinase/adenosylcobinamide-phosphate guanylyltransferase [Leptolyngbyaceae cyanobacterium]
MTQQILVLGPTKSGKSEWAERLACQSSRPVTYVATSRHDPQDAEWQARIVQHRQRRPQGWQTRETPVELVATLSDAAASECWLVDSLGTWVANQLDQSEADWQRQTQQLLTTIADFPGLLILVAEETGWGVVPAYASGRLFRDRLGSLTRQIGAIVEVSYLVVAGFALDLQRLGIAVESINDPVETDTYPPNHV